MQRSGDRNHVIAEILYRDVDHLKANWARHLFKILSGDADPFVVILDQPPQLPVKPVKFWLKRVVRRSSRTAYISMYSSNNS